jgi:hypothetical protein
MRRTVLVLLLGSLLLAAVSPAVAATGAPTPSVHAAGGSLLAGLWARALAALGLAPGRPPIRIVPTCGGGGADPNGHCL